MKKRRALIRAYTLNNLGDDLFVSLLLNKFKDVMFYTDNDFDFSTILENTDNYKALSLFKTKALSPLNKVIRFLFSFKCKTTIEIGGSIFIFPQAIKQISGRLHKWNIKHYFIIGTNYGPYRNEEERLLGLKLFQKVPSVVFREKYSYELFPELENSAYAADIVFSYQPPKDMVHRNHVVIAVVDYERFEYGEAYLNRLMELIQYYTSKEHKVILFSFCEIEGDNKTIAELQKRLRRENRINLNHISTHTHHKLKESLDLLQQSHTIIASRFHAMVLGWVLRKQTIVLPYSSKFTNVIQEFFPEQKYFMIDTLDRVTTKEILQSYFVADQERLSQYRSDALRHFSKLEDYFGSSTQSYSNKKPRVNSNVIT